LEGKLRPYLLPIYDSLAACGINKKALNSLIRDGTVEVAPLSFMRGRTFRNSFVIADEMQNATADQMKMLLTRLGQGSRIVVTGDIMQSDLPEGLRRSGLVDSIRRLEGRSSKHVKLVRLQKTDVVRHDAVSSILSLYEPPRRSNHQNESVSPDTMIPFDSRQDSTVDLFAVNGIAANGEKNNVRVALEPLPLAADDDVFALNLDDPTVHSTSETDAISSSGENQLPPTHTEDEIESNKAVSKIYSF
jgi:hypothetical protein